MSRKESNVIEFDYGGCSLTDRGSVEDIDAIRGGEAHYLGRPGIVEAIWLIEGTTPWPGPPWPRPVYRVRWRSALGKSEGEGTDEMIDRGAEAWQVLRAALKVPGEPGACGYCGTGRELLTPDGYCSRCDKRLEAPDDQ